MIRVVVNGVLYELREGATLSSLMSQLDINPVSALALERNRVVIPRPNWTTTTVSDGDVLEIVSLVGGG